MKFLFYLVSVVLVTSQCNAHSITKRSGSDSDSGSSSDSSASSVSSVSAASAASVPSVPVVPVLPAGCEEVITFFSGQIADLAALETFINNSPLFAAFRTQLTPFIAQVAAGTISVADTLAGVNDLLTTFEGVLAGCNIQLTTATRRRRQATVQLSASISDLIRQYFTESIPATHPEIIAANILLTGPTPTAADLVNFIATSPALEQFRQDGYNDFLAAVAAGTLSPIQIILQSIGLLNDLTTILRDQFNIELPAAVTSALTSYFIVGIPAVPNQCTTITDFFNTPGRTAAEVETFITTDPSLQEFRDATLTAFLDGIANGPTTAATVGALATAQQALLLAFIADLPCNAVLNGDGTAAIATYFATTVPALFAQCTPISAFFDAAVPPTTIAVATFISSDPAVQGFIDGGFQAFLDSVASGALFGLDLDTAILAQKAAFLQFLADLPCNIDMTNAAGLINTYFDTTLPAQPNLCTSLATFSPVDAAAVGTEITNNLFLANFRDSGFSSFLLLPPATFSDRLAAAIAFSTQFTSIITACGTTLTAVEFGFVAEYLITGQLGL